MKDNTFSDTMIALFVKIDDLVKAYRSTTAHSGHLYAIGSEQQGRRTCNLSGSEVAIILVCYHLSHYKTFKHYYEAMIMGIYRDYFPHAPGYHHFLTLLIRAMPVLLLWALYTCEQALKTGYYYVDSKKLPVCHINRQHSHRVFKDWAKKGKTSTGWFFGFKLHLVINHLGQIVRFAFSSARMADNNHSLLLFLFSQLNGKCAGDKGYYTKLFDHFYEKGLQLILKPKRNTKRKLPALPTDIQFHRGRAVVESTNNILQSVCNIEHTRHRKPENAISHMLAAIIAYQALPVKPHVFIPNAINYLKEAS